MYGDVKYGPDAMLVIDRKKKAWDLEDVRKHVTQQLETQSVTATDGSTMQLLVKDYPISVCCHSDSPGCVEIIKTTNEVVDKFNKEHGR
jgi:lactam utilization protein B